MKYLLPLFSWLCACTMQAQQLAFPGAEGYGAYAAVPGTSASGWEDEMNLIP